MGGERKRSKQDVCNGEERSRRGWGPANELGYEIMGGMGKREMGSGGGEGEVGEGDKQGQRG